jgi:anti-anti-sigma factor
MAAVQPRTPALEQSMTLPTAYDGPPGRGDPLLRLRVEPLQDPPGVRVVLAGELDAATAPQLRIALEELATSAAGVVRLELTDVPFCDLSGLRVMLDADRALRSSGGHLTVADPCPSLCVLITALDVGSSLLADPRVLQAYRYRSRRAA